MFLPSLILIFCLVYTEFQAISMVYAWAAAESSGFSALLFIALSFLAMASFGGWLIRHESQALVQSLKASPVASARPKPNVLAFIAGLLFLIPGYVTDGMALVLLFPPTAWFIRKLFAKKLKSFAQQGNVRFYGSFGGRGAAPHSPYQTAQGPDRISSDPQVIDVEVTRS